MALEITELKTFYQNKIHEIQRSQEDNIKKLSDRLKYYESRYPEDEFMVSSFLLYNFYNHRYTIFQDGMFCLKTAAVFIFYLFIFNKKKLIS